MSFPVRGATKLPANTTFEEYTRIIETLKNDEQFPQNIKAAYISMLEQQWAMMRLEQVIRDNTAAAPVGEKRLRTSK